MVITEPAVASTRLLGLISKLYPKQHAAHAQQRFYSIDSCTRVRQKKDCAGRMYVNMFLLNPPGTRRCLKTSYRKRMYSYLLFCNLAPYKTLHDWPINGSGYQRTYIPDGLLEATYLSFEWYQWPSIVLVAWYSCEIYIESKIGSALFVQKKTCVLFIYTKNLISGRKNAHLLHRLNKSKFSVKSTWCQ